MKTISLGKGHNDGSLITFAVLADGVRVDAVACISLSTQKTHCIRLVEDFLGHLVEVEYPFRNLPDMCEYLRLRYST